MADQIKDILRKLHSSERKPRLEIEGCKYPINEELIKNYKNSDCRWIEHDGFGGQTGSVNVSLDYLDYLSAVKGDRCAYVIKDKWERKDYYHTEIDYEYLLFRKSDLIKVIEGALSSTNRTDLRNISGKRVLDEVIWDDSIPYGPGLRVIDVNIRLCVDLTQEEPRYKIECEKSS